MNLNKFIEIIDGILINIPSNFNYNISIDTRTINKNDIFIPISFKDGNGNKYIKEAVLKGANTVLIPKDYLESTNILYEILTINNDIGIIEIDNGLEVLKRLAFNKRDNFKGVVIGITGSVGKTSTKELLAQVLSKKYKVFKTEKNYNNILGLSLMLLKLEDEEYAVFEMGMNRLGEISEMSKILKPHIGLITNIGTAHIGNLLSKENILKAKLEIIDGFNDEGILFINEEDEYLNKIDYHNVYRYNTIDNEVYNGTIKVNIESEEVNLELNGKHNIYNISSIYVISKYLGIEDSLIIEAIKEYKDIRMNEIYIKDTLIIDDSYNASLESMINGIKYINLTNYDNKVLVLGDMLELGLEEIEIHKDLGKYIRNTSINKVYTYGDISRYIGYTCNKISYHFNDKDKLAMALKEELLDNTVIYIKGSHNMNLSKLVDMIK